MIFADTAFFIALLSPADEWHEAAVRHSRRVRERLLTSVWICVPRSQVSLGNALLAKFHFGGAERRTKHSFGETRVSK